MSLRNLHVYKIQEFHWLKIKQNVKSMKIYEKLLCIQSERVRRQNPEPSIAFLLCTSAHSLEPSRNPAGNFPGTPPTTCLEPSQNRARPNPKYSHRTREQSQSVLLRHMYAPRSCSSGRNGRSLELQKRQKVNGVIARSAVFIIHISAQILQAWTEATRSQWAHRHIYLHWMRLSRSFNRLERYISFRQCD